MAIAKNFLKKLDRFSLCPSDYPFAMAKLEQAAFEQEVSRSNHYIEFGLGGSTLRALQKSKAIIHTVESDPEWITSMRRYLLLRLHEGKRLHILPVDIGPVGAWGFPISDGPQESFPNYSETIFQSIKGADIDLALIDGRFRVACILRTILECHANPHLRIMIHDFWNRPQYHSVLPYLETVKAIDTMGIFTVKPDIDTQAILAGYEAYKFIPD